MNAIRSYARMIKGKAAMQMTVSHEFLADPAAWRARVTPLIVAAGGRRSDLQRQAARSFDETYTKEEETRSYIRLNQTRYISWAMFWERMSEDQARQRFLDKLEEQQSENEDSDGEPTVWIKDNCTQAKTSGSRKVKQQDVGASADGSAPKRRQFGGGSRDGMGDDDDMTEGDAADDKKDLPKLDGKRKMDHTSDLTERVLTERNLARLSHGTHGGQAHRRQPLDEKTTRAETTPRRTVAQLKARDELLKDSKKALEEVTGSRGVYSCLSKKVKTVSEQQLALLDLSPAEVLKKLNDEFITPLKQLHEEVPQLSVKEVEAKRAELNALLEKLPGLEEPCKELSEAIDHLSAGSKNEARKEVMARRYQVDKVARSLATGGFPKAYGKHLATKIVAHQAGAKEEELPQFVRVQADPTTFEKSLVNVFVTPLPGGDVEANMVGYVMKIIQDTKMPLAQKMYDMSRLMTKKSWRSAMANLDFPLNWEKPAGMDDDETAEYMQDPGALPWIFGVKANTWKHGPSETTMPGFAQVLVPLQIDVFVLVFELKGLLNQGIAAPDIFSFLESPSGAEFVHSHSAMVHLKVGEPMWVPFGFAPVILYVPGSKDLETKFPYGYVMSVTAWLLSEAEGLDAAVWAGIASMTSKAMEKVRASKVWTSRADLYERFNKAVQDRQKTT